MGLIVRGLIVAIYKSNIGCNIGGLFFNIIACTDDDLVLITPSLHALQFLIDIMSTKECQIDMLCRLNKTKKKHG